MKDRARKYVTYVFSNLSDTGCNSFVLDYESKHQDPDNNLVTVTNGSHCTYWHIIIPYFPRIMILRQYGHRPNKSIRNRTGI